MHPHAGGLIVCDGIEHANAISKALKHLTGEDSVVVHSESGKDTRAIEKFTEDKTPSRTKWIIAVGKISEGVDIKFLRVCVYMTTITAALRWTQIIGRILRTEKEIDWEKQTAHFYQYEDGMETVTDENGNYVMNSTTQQYEREYYTYFHTNTPEAFAVYFTMHDVVVYDLDDE